MLLLSLEKLFLGRLLERLPRFVGHVWTLVCVVFSFYIFVFDNSIPALSPAAAKNYLAVLFGLRGAGVVGGDVGYDIWRHLPLLAVCIFGMTPLPKRLFWRWYEKHRAVRFAAAVACTLGLFICTAYLIDSSYNPFLYFRF